MRARIADALKGPVYAHGLCHIGEVEYSRSLVELSNLTMKEGTQLGAGKQRE